MNAMNHTCIRAFIEFFGRQQILRYTKEGRLFHFVSLAAFLHRKQKYTYLQTTVF